MAYQALARKWRPRTFSEIVGQEHVVKALTHALQCQRLHHAYLFTGTRGVGKTTIARIFAKAINCETPKGIEPCGQCSVCREVDEGRFVDLIEVDAASRTKVEDTRELMENVLYAPAQGRYKVYLIDEVHMLSAHSFNALLKTLEEPPPHIKFLLATTDPQKIPVTVLSRCLQFNLKRLSPIQIGEQMQAILSEEGIAYDVPAVKSLARAADGSMRDGLSLLDQAIVHGGGRLVAEVVTAMLGTVARQPVYELLDALAASDAVGLLGIIDELASHSPDFGEILQHLLIVLHHAVLAQWVPDAVKKDEDADRILEFAQYISPEDLQLFYQIGLVGQRDLPLAPDPRMGFEMVLLRMLAFRQVVMGQEPGMATISHPPSPDKFQSTRSPRPAVKYVSPKPLPAAPTEVVSVPEALAMTETSLIASSAPAVSDWGAMIDAMGLVAMTRQLASHCILEQLDQEVCVLVLNHQMGIMRSQTATANLEKALQDYLQRPVKLTIREDSPASETPALRAQRQQAERQRAAEIEIEQDDTVRAMKDMFDARIIPGSIKPID